MLTLHFLPPKQNLLYTPPSPNPNPKKIPQIQSTPTQISTMGYEASATPATALAPGFRFHPTDEELVRYYLKRKVCGKSFRFDAISEIDIYKSEPWDLPGKSKLKGRDLQWYFFSPLDKKYGNGSRMNRATGEGYWKATGNDRPIRHDFRNVGMKKTLVFHKGRAPGGKRTDWVMHEYRLVDEELEKAVYQKKDLEKASEDGYVLCRVFQKSGPGPRNGDQYALFFEDEWEDDRSVLVPGAEAVDKRTAGDYARPEGTNLLQDTPQKKAPLHQTEHSRDSQNVPFVCKIERADDCLLPSMNGPEPFQIVGNKRLRQNDSDPSQTNGSESSTTATQDPCPIATTTATATETKTNLPSAPLELPLLESIENRESSPVPVQRYDAGTLNMSMPPGCMEFINNLQKEIHNISFERQTLKIEVMSAQAMINILQSRIEFLTKENEDLKRMIRD